MCGTHGVGIVRWRRFCDNWGERGGGRIGLMGGVIDRMILEREKMAEGGVLPFVIVIVFIVFFIPPPLPLHPIPPAIGSRRDGDGESRDENERRGRLVGGGGGGTANMVSMMWGMSGSGGGDGRTWRPRRTRHINEARDAVGSDLHRYRTQRR
jgi:hypothetical protein